MHIRFFLLLIAAMAIFACGNAPQNTENQTESTSSETVEASAAAAVETPSTTPAAPEPGGEPAPSPAEPAANAAPPKPSAKPVAVKNDQPAEASKKQPAPQNTNSPEAPQPAEPVSKPAEKTPEKAPVTAPAATEKPAAPQPPSHESWDKLLRQYVSETGKVNYSGFKKDKAKLESYLDILQKNPPQNDWSRAEKMAFWINAYNAFTVKLIVDNYPISSIMKLDGGKPWDRKWINIGGKTYSLNNIENDILRPQFKDPRIHFAVNCAAKSCPPLLNRAWTAANLESNFEKQARAFINNPGFNKISEKEVEVSKIFDWYSGDFGNLIDYLNKYSNTKINANAKVKFREYDWALNE